MVPLPIPQTPMLPEQTSLHFWQQTEMCTSNIGTVNILINEVNNELLRSK